MEVLSGHIRLWWTAQPSAGDLWLRDWALHTHRTTKRQWIEGAHHYWTALNPAVMGARLLGGWLLWHLQLCPDVSTVLWTRVNPPHSIPSLSSSAGCMLDTFKIQFIVHRAQCQVSNCLLAEVKLFVRLFSSSLKQIKPNVSGQVKSDHKCWMGGHSMHILTTGVNRGGLRWIGRDRETSTDGRQCSST